MMGVPANYLLHVRGAAIRRRRSLVAAARRRRRRADAGGAARRLGRARRRDRPGLRAHRGGAERALPAVRGRASQGRARRAGRTRTSSAGSSAEGELLVRGPNVFPGYWRNPDATAAAFRDGWLLTGDVAECDDEGDYWIRGRLKEMVVSGGENVYPAEIEAVLQQHEAVVEAAVVGVPDERWGEVCAAFVVCRAPVADDELREFCRARLARFKVPKSFHRRRRPAAQRGRQGRQGRAGADGGERDDRGRHQRSRQAALRSAGSTRGGGCSTRPSRSSASSGTTTPRSSSSRRPPASRRARSTSTSTRRRRSSTSSCAT